MPKTLRLLTGYAVMLGAAAVVLAGVHHWGVRFGMPAIRGAAPGGAGEPSLVVQVLLAMAVVTLTARATSLALQRWLKQPPVIGEIVAGVLLGPSVLGALAPAAYEVLLPAPALPHLATLAKVGVVLFMFLVGLELDFAALKNRPHDIVVVSHAGIVGPFVLGALLAVALYERYRTPTVPFMVFALFLGVSMSVTAFPVLARILTDRGLQRTPLGTTALACAAVDDASAWFLLAVVSGIARAAHESALEKLALIALYVAVMLMAVRPLLRRLLARFRPTADRPLPMNGLAVMMAALLLSAATTEAIGIHALFGAFLLGALMPHEARIVEPIRNGLQPLVLVLLLPAFFVLTGARTQLSLLGSAQDWAVCGAIIVVATLGKLGGCALAARWTGHAWGEATALGVLMNTRGLMELIVLNVGLEMGVLSPTLFTMFVVMAIVTTFAAAPLLDLLQRRREIGPSPLRPVIAVEPSPGA